MKRASKRTLKISTAALAILGFSTQAFAGAAYIYEMIPTEVGTAGAGSAAKAQNASTVFTNPAGMTYIDHTEIEAGATLMYLNAPFSSQVGTTATGRSGDTTEWFGGGNFSYVQPLGDGWTFGLSVQNFFGLSLNWQDDWLGRYSSTKEWLIAPQIQPTIAYKVNDWLSLGAGLGFTVGYLKTYMKIYKPDTTPIDGRAKLRDTAFAIQGNLGAMIQANEDLRIGLRYLTETKLAFKPSVTTKGVGPGATAALDALGGLDLGLYMPQSLNIAAFYQLNEQWALLGDFGWEDWSRFGKLDVGFGRTGQLGVANIETKDVYHYGIATQYQFDESLMLSAGFSFDSQLQDNANRSLILPLKDMYRYGAGFEKEMSEDFTLGAGLDFVWEGDTPVQATDAGAGVIHGQYTSVYFVFASVYGVWKF
ncbi:MAG: hypothetical protein COB07_00240 [Sulfurovum sp.]|nr:MAG: hypothetical protein COB07_00240 [Sulfurovum sp.]